VTVETLTKHFNKLGYDVHFTVEKRNDAGRDGSRDHPTAKDQQRSSANGEYIQCDDSAARG
jgi:hypothetical protein